MSGEEKMGIWNGDEFVFKDSGWAIVSFIKLFYRYGFQVFKLNRYLKIIRVITVQRKDKSALHFFQTGI